MKKIIRGVCLVIAIWQAWLMLPVLQWLGSDDFFAQAEAGSVLVQLLVHLTLVLIFGGLWAVLKIPQG